MNEENGIKKRQKRKKKNSRFLANAKGFAKQGIYGRGTHIDDDQYKYFINILDAMKTGFEDVEDKVNMANNVFEQTNDQEIHLASNQIVCKVLETLVGYVDSENLERFFTVFSTNFRPICSDRFASHVLQKMVEIAFLRAVGTKAIEEEENDTAVAKRAKVDVIPNEEQYNLQTQFSLEHVQNCGNFVMRVGKFLLNNLEDFVWDSCANHIMRTCILSLAGVHVAKVAFEKGGADMAKNRKLYKVPTEWTEVMKEFPNRLEMWPHFVDFPYQEHSSALLGVICIALKVADKNILKHFGKKILMDAMLKTDENDDDDEKNKKVIIINDEDEEANEEGKETQQEDTDKSIESPATHIKLPKVFLYQSAVILLETLLSLAGPKLLTQLYAMLFAGRVSLLAQEHLTNFSVQKLLQHIKELEDFESIFNELNADIESLLKIGHTGVVSALAAACLRLSTKQSQMIVALQSALHVAGDKERAPLFFQCLVKLKPYELIREDKSAFVHLHGSLIVQSILKFNKPIMLVNCIIDSTSADQLAVIFNTPNGSHIADAFLHSKFIGEKSREKIIRHLEGYYVDLAVTRCGSHVLEHLFAAAQETQKARIAKELSERLNLLKGTPFGRLLYNKLRIETYRLSAAQWKASLSQQKEQKAEQLFKDIIN